MGTWFYSEYSSDRSSGKCCGGSKFRGAGCKTAATVVAFGVSNATAIYLGKTIGAKEFHLAKEYGKRFLWLSIITGAVGGGTILIAAPIANHVMTLSQEAQGYLYFMFFVMSYFTLCQAINTTLVVGVFRAGGDTRFGLILDVSTM